MRVEFSREAQAEADDAAAHWNIDEDLGIRFEAELERAIEHIELGPERWQRPKHGTRRILLKRFPYALIYQVTTRRLEPNMWRELPRKEKGFQSGDNIYYQCLLCNTIIPSSFPEYIKCTCGNIYLDTDAARLGVDDPSKIRILEWQP